MRTLLRHSSVYSLAPIVQRIASIVLIPLYTGILADSEWGLLDIADVVILLVPQLVGINLLGGMTRFYFEHEDKRDRNAVVSSVTLLLAFASWAVVGIALAFRTDLADLFFLKEGAAEGADYAQLLTLALLIVPFSLTTRAGLQYLQILRMSRASTAIQTAKTVLELALKIWALVGLGWGMEGFLASVLVGEALTTTLLTGWMLWSVRPRIVGRVLVPMVRYALPLLPVGLLQLGLHQADRLLLRAHDPGLPGESDWNGVYALGYKIGFLLHGAVLTSFMQIWQPLIFGTKEGDGRDKVMVRVGTYAMIVLAGIYVPAILYGREAVHLLAGQESYLPAYLVAPWITCAYLLYAVYSLSQVSLFVAKRTGPLVWINGSALLANLALNQVLIPRYGFVGAAWATLGSFALLALLGAREARRLGRLPFEPRRVVLVLAAGLACVGVARFVDERSEAFSAASLGIKAGAALVAGLTLSRVVLDAEGRAGLVQLGRDLLKRVR